MITEKTVKIGKHACGFCSTGGRHDLCPGGVLNGNGIEILLCACNGHQIVRRCIDCGTRGNDEVSDKTWTCLDAEGCAARREARRNEILVELYGGVEGDDGTRTIPAKTRTPRQPAKSKEGKCLHCGEPTKGGLFLPGHDSKYLSGAIESIRGGKYSLQDVQQLWGELGVSDALQGKLAKRVA